jgi:hypothetical protein
MSNKRVGSLLVVAVFLFSIIASPAFRGSVATVFSVNQAFAVPNITPEMGIRQPNEDVGRVATNCPIGDVCTPATSTLGGNAGSSAGSDSCYNWSTFLTIGSRGADVVALQTVLLADGYSIPLISSGAAAKGYFGPSTAYALGQYQIRNGIYHAGSATGILDAQTMAYLNANACATTPTTPGTGNQIVASLDASSPLTSTVQISASAVTNNIPLAVFDLKSAGVPSTLKTFSIVVPTTNSAGQTVGPNKFFSNIFIEIDGQTFAETSSVGQVVTFNNLSVGLPANTYVPITVLVSVPQDTSSSLDGSSASASMVLTAITAIDATGATVPIYHDGTGADLISGKTLTFTAGGISTVSNTSVILGSPIMSSGIVTAYPVTFTFSVTAGNNAIYIGIPSANTSSLVFDETSSSDILPNIVSMIANPSQLLGDGTGYYEISAGSTRTFTVSGSVVNPSGSSIGNRTIQLDSIDYGTSPNALATAQLNFSNLKTVALFNGTTVTNQPTISLNVPSGNWVANNQYGISWNASSGISTVRLAYYAPGSASNGYFAQGIPASNGSYTFTTGASMAPGQYMLLIQGLDSNNNVLASAQGVFTVALANNQTNLSTVPGVAAPVITSVTPYPAVIGSAMTITGSGFTSSGLGTFVELNAGSGTQSPGASYSIPLGSATISSNGTTITFATPNPSAGPGTYNVAVANLNNPAATRFSNSMSVTLAASTVSTASVPVISSITPSATIGNTTVVISGSGFVPGDIVNFTAGSNTGSPNASYVMTTGFTVAPDGSTITFLAPNFSAGAGTYSVVVGSPSNPSASRYSNQVSINLTNPVAAAASVAAPVISSISPLTAAVGSTVTITGSGFTSSGSLPFLIEFSAATGGSYTLSSNSFTVSPDGTTMTFVMPNFSAGPGVYTVAIANLNNPSGSRFSNGVQMTMIAAPASGASQTSSVYGAIWDSIRSYFGGQ